MAIEIPPHRPTSLPETASEQANANSRITNPDKVQGNINSQIINAQQSANINAANEPLALIYSAAIESLTEQLAPALGVEEVEGTEAAPDEFSPEATARSIVDFATNFYGQYKLQNPELSEEEALDSFMTIITDAIETGYNEAVQILGALDAFEGDVQNTAEETMSLIEQYLADFKAEQEEGFTEAVI